MTRMFSTVAESVLRRVVPKVKAEAWWSGDCYCSGAGNQYSYWCYRYGNDVRCDCELRCYVCCV
jgi:hypothetical protein